MRRRILAVHALAALAPGCAISARTMGMHDPTIDVVKALAEAQVATVQAITAALSRAQANACAIPEVR